MQQSTIMNMAHVEFFVVVFLIFCSSSGESKAVDIQMSTALGEREKIEHCFLE